MTSLTVAPSTCCLICLTSFRENSTLPNTRAANHIGGQLLRSGTSPLFNHGEAQAAESSKDFVHKMKIALKELRETLVWLKIIARKPLCEPQKMSEIANECDELIAIFVKSIKTAQEKGDTGPKG